MYTPGFSALKVKLPVLARHDLRHLGATAGAGDRVQVDAVGDARVCGIVQVDLDGVAFADPQHRAWHGAIEGPVLVGHAIGHRAVDFLRRQVDISHRPARCA